MQNLSSLTQAIDQIKKDVQRETAELQQKETALRANQTIKQNLDASLRTKDTEIKQKDSEIQKIKMDIQQIKNKSMEADRNTKRISDEIANIKRDQAMKNMQLQKAQADLQSAMKK